MKSCNTCICLQYYYSALQIKLLLIYNNRKINYFFHENVSNVGAGVDFAPDSSEI